MEENLRELSVKEKIGLTAMLIIIFSAGVFYGLYSVDQNQNIGTLSPDKDNISENGSTIETESASENIENDYWLECEYSDFILLDTLYYRYVCDYQGNVAHSINGNSNKYKGLYDEYYEFSTAYYTSTEMILEQIRDWLPDKHKGIDIILEDNVVPEVIHIKNNRSLELQIEIRNDKENITTYGFSDVYLVRDKKYFDEFYSDIYPIYKGMIMWLFDEDHIKELVYSDILIFYHDNMTDTYVLLYQDTIPYRQFILIDLDDIEI